MSGSWAMWGYKTVEGRYVLVASNDLRSVEFNPHVADEPTLISAKKQYRVPVTNNGQELTVRSRTVVHVTGADHNECMAKLFMSGWSFDRPDDD